MAQSFGALINPLDPSGYGETAPWMVNASPQIGGNLGSRPGPTFPQQSQNNLIGGNLSNVANIAKLAAGIGGASGAGGAANLNTALPGATGALQSTLQLGLGEEAGQLPQADIDLLQQQAAERGIATGSPGSANANAAYLRALGLTENQIQQQGVQNVATAIGQAPVGPQFNPASQLITPELQVGTEQQNALNAAAPDPTAVAEANMAAERAGLGAGGVAPPGSFSLPNLTPPDLGLGISPATAVGGSPGGYTASTGANNPFPNPYQPAYGNLYGGSAGGGGGQTSQWIPNGDGTFTDPETGEVFDANGNSMAASASEE